MNNSSMKSVFAALCAAVVSAAEPAATALVTGDVDRGKSWIHVDKVTRRDGGAQINVNHVIFTAKSEKVDVTFSNRAPPVGTRLGINGIGVLPYFGE